MEYQFIVNELALNRNVFRELLRELPIDMQTWKPEPGKWCLLEIICHLYDEEREDFRARMQHVLSAATGPMPPIDPQGWVTTRKYMEQDYDDRVNNFLAERERSLTILKTLKAPQWANIYHHPKLGDMSAGLFLSSWLAHDYLHIRQITAIKYKYLQAHTDADISYAGNW